MRNCLRAERHVTLAPRSTTALSDVDLWGAFFDTAYAYRFGPPSHDVTVARLQSATGEPIAEAFHFPLGRAAIPAAAGLKVSLEQDDRGWVVRISASSFAQSICIEDAAFVPEDNWFHLAPGYEKVVRMTPRKGVRRSEPGGTTGSLFGPVLTYGAPA